VAFWADDVQKKQLAYNEIITRAKVESSIA
jgi:hypothetical protein